MLASLHVADVGLTASFRVKHPDPAEVPGLVDARSGLMARFNRAPFPDPAWGRVMWLGFWEDEQSLDQFLASDFPVVKTFEDGWSMRLEPLRGHGTWPGFPTDLEPDDGGYRGPVVVLTIGLLRLGRSMAWTRASNKIQKQFLDAPGVIWAMGASRPPLFAATVSIWESASATTGFAHEKGGAHAQAVRDSSDKPFMTQELFARFKPLSTTGHLTRNPELSQDWLSKATN